MAKKQRDSRQRVETLATLLMPIYEEKLEESLGNRLRELRRQQALSLRALAEKSGLSANTLSLIENGKTSPSVATLQQIALALNIPITAFFENKNHRNPVIHTRRAERNATPFSHGTMEELGDLGRDTLQPFMVTFNPHSSSGPEPLTHDGCEFVYCMQGRVDYNIFGEPYALEAGDSLLFSSRMPHSWENPQDEPAMVMIIMSAHEEPKRSLPVQYPV